MSSQDTLTSAKAEEESAKILQGEIESNQASIDALQRDISSKMAVDGEGQEERQIDIDTLQRDIDKIMQVNAGLQQAMQEHLNNAQRLHQQVNDEQQQEQQEQLRQQQENSDKSVGETAKEGVINNLF